MHPTEARGGSPSTRDGAGTLPRIWRALLWLAFALGIVASDKLVVALFAIDADSSHSLMIFDGVKAYGLPWLASWRFTQDNRILSLLPMHAIAYQVWGERTDIVVFGGWALFVANAVMSGVVARQLGARRAALPITVLLLFVGSYGHLRGFVSYSTSHNVTNLYGLFALSSMSAWLVGMIADDDGHQAVTVHVNGVEVGGLRYDREHPRGERRVVVPKAVAERSNGALDIRFILPHAASPARRRLPGDTRQSSFGISSLMLTQVAEGAASP